MPLSDISNILQLSIPLPPSPPPLDYFSDLVEESNYSSSPKLRRVSARLRTKSENALKSKVIALNGKLEVDLKGSDETIEILRRKFIELKRENDDLKAINEVVMQRAQVDKEVSTKDSSTVCIERDFLRNSLQAAQNEVIHHDTELEVLREALQESSLHLTELRLAKEFAEAETESVRRSLKEKDVAIETQLAEFLQLNTNYEIVIQDLNDALAREARQEESSRCLMLSQQELETAYDEAIAQLESWKRDQVEDGIEEYAYEGTLQEEDEDEEENFLPVANEDLTRHKTSLDGYDVIDFQREFLGSSLSLGQNSFVSTRSSFRDKIRNLVNPRSSRPSPQAVKLFAIKELEDDLLAYKLHLTLLVDDFTQTDNRKLRRLQRLQENMERCIRDVRLTATKLKAVNNFRE